MWAHDPVLFQQCLDSRRELLCYFYSYSPSKRLIEQVSKTIVGMACPDDGYLAALYAQAQHELSLIGPVYVPEFPLPYERPCISEEFYAHGWRICLD